MRTIQLPRPLVNRLMAEAQKSPEREVCGLVGATSGGASHAYPVTNGANQPERLFQMDPQGQIAAMRDLREAGEELFAIYHSHPHAPARPSATDVSESAYPQALHLIISLNTTGVLEMAGYYIRDGRVEEVALAVG